MRVQIYLPIADIPVNIFLILAMGAAVGFVSGMFGVGGGFLMTPLLIFVGIAPAVAVASVASHIAASSFSGAISYWRRRAIDPALEQFMAQRAGSTPVQFRTASHVGGLTSYAARFVKLIERAIHANEPKPGCHHAA